MNKFTVSYVIQKLFVHIQFYIINVERDMFSSYKSLEDAITYIVNVSLGKYLFIYFCVIILSFTRHMYDNC